MKLKEGVSYDSPIDPANPGNWRLMHADENFRTWELDDGDRIHRKTEFLGTLQLAEENRRVLNESADQRWGKGQVFASVPLNVYFSSGWADANKQQDIKWMNQFVRDNPQYRKFKGEM
jgi:hypothetical protein